MSGMAYNSLTAHYLWYRPNHVVSDLQYLTARGKVDSITFNLTAIASYIHRPNHRHDWVTCPFSKLPVKEFASSGRTIALF